MVHAIANNFHYICNGSFNFNHNNFKFILLCLFNFDKSRLFDDYNWLHGNQSHLNTPIQHLFLLHLIALFPFGTTIWSEIGVTRNIIRLTTKFTRVAYPFPEPFANFFLEIPPRYPLSSVKRKEEAKWRP